jgi:hypothetical protein
MHLKLFLSVSACALFLAASAAAASFTPIAELSGPSGINNYFGYSVATDGQRVLVGSSSNRAYLYDPFTQQQLASLTVPGGFGGTSVALQGNTGVVGAASAARVYNFSNPGSPTSFPLTVPDNGAAGGAVDISGDVIIAGGVADQTAEPRSGAAYLFDRATGAQFAKLIPNDSQPFDSFGISVAIDDGLAAVGAARSSAEGGSVYLFDARPGVVGNRQLDEDEQPIPQPIQYFGYNVDLNDQTLVATEAFGQSYLWSVGGAPAPLPLSSPNTRATADGISVSDDYIALGFEGQGLVRLYDKAGNLLRNLTAPPGSTSGFGISVAIEGDLLVVGGGGTAGAPTVLVYSVQDLLVPEPGAVAAMSAPMGCWLVWIRRRQDVRCSAA